METKQLKGVVDLFNNIACMEDDIAPVTSGDAAPETKISRFKQAIAEKKAMVKRTHKATLTIRTESRAKAYVIAAADVWSAAVSADAAVVEIVRGRILDDDGISSYPDGVDVFDVKDILDISLDNFHESAQLAVMNQATAENKSKAAEAIVKALDLQNAVDKVAALNKAAQTPSGGLQIMWFPMSGWGQGPYGQGITNVFNGPVTFPNSASPDAVCPIDPFITSGVPNNTGNAA